MNEQSEFLRLSARTPLLLAKLPSWNLTAKKPETIGFPSSNKQGLGFLSRQYLDFNVSPYLAGGKKSLPSFLSHFPPLMTSKIRNKQALAEEGGRVYPGVG